jgi:hypothetical protein
MEAMKNEFNEALLISRTQISKPPETAFRDIHLPPSYFNQTLTKIPNFTEI